MKNNILFIHQGKGFGGASLCLKELIDEVYDNYNINILCIYDGDAAKYFKKSGFKTDVLNSYFYQKFYTYFYHSEAFEFRLSRPIYILKSIVSYIFNLFIAPKIVKSYNPSLVHLNSSVLTDWAIVSKKCGYKVVIHIREPIAHGFFGVRKKIIQIIIKNYTDRIVAISKDNASRLNLMNKTTIIYDPIRNVNITKTPSVDKNKHYFLYLGGSQAIKGFNTLVESLPYLNDDVIIFFAGGMFDCNLPKGFISKIKYYFRFILRPSHRRMLNNISVVNKSNNTIMLGVIENIYNYLAISSALLFPSTRSHFADPVLEAYKIGKPVIVSDVVGMDEIVNRKTGLFFRKNDEKDLAEQINELAGIDDNLVEEYKKNCTEKFGYIQSKNNRIIDVFNLTINN
jgi:glycosyltransferase involved in cell wall biosynthesis